MGETTATIKDSMILVALDEEESATGKKQDPKQFNFEKAPSDFKRKVYKKVLEEIIRKLDEHDDLHIFPRDSLVAIRQGLTDTRRIFSSLLASKILDDHKREINEILPFLNKALAKTYEAITLLEEREIRRSDYYLALLECQDQLFQIKLRL
ncbi:MAG TPA: hypothetical protein VKV20_05820 [Ktedonobacteraceae bacterium]|jgi:hypothetical protein|nr:hypothetical protein [Ktedonobacteraceae bacterium]